MISRILLGGFFLSVAVAMSPQIIAAQVQGMAGGARGVHGGGAIRGAHHARLTRGEHRRSYGGFLFYPGFDYYDDNYDRNYEPPEVRHVAMEPAANVAVAAATKPAESLILENRGGQWVRIPTATQMPVSQGYVEPQAASSGPGTTGSKGTPTPPAKLPPPVLVFRDGHEEQVARYVVQGNVLYTGADYWSTGSWTRQIPIAQLDVPASVKRSAELGGIFSMPTRPNEVVVRF
jgi:hypothetical protein